MDRNTKLTENFRFGEFASRGRLPSDQKVIKRLKRLAHNLQVLRDEIGRPITIINGWRSPSHNTSVGGAKNSRHMAGDGADIVVEGMTPQEVYEVIERLQKEGKMDKGGVHAYRHGPYPFLHYDCRGWNARW